MGRTETEKAFRASVALLGLGDSAPDHPEWEDPFAGRIGSEKELHDLSDGRLKISHKLDKLLRGTALPNGSIIDSVIVDSETGLYRVLVEYKKPVYNGSRGPKKLSFLAHLDQLMNYASQLMLNNPAIPFLAIVLTDGYSFVAGYAKRSSLGHLDFVLCETPLSLYKWSEKGRGADFGLFWTLATATTPPPISTELVVQRSPQIKMLVERCIGNGSSSLVYEGRLATELEGTDAQDSLYLALKACNAVAIKVPKEDEKDVLITWKAELLAFEEFKKANTLDCCVFPICWEESFLKQAFIIYPLCVPVVPTVSVKPAAVSPLKAWHFVGLLEDLCKIHNVGLIHRDVRLENIVIFGDEAKLIDFGYSSPPAKSEHILGTLATASQDVLAGALGSKTKPFAYKKRDDLESLLKVFLMHQWGVKIKYVDKKPRTESLYEGWAQLIDGLGIRGQDYAGLRAYLMRFFGRHTHLWKEHKFDP